MCLRFIQRHVEVNSHQNRLARNFNLIDRFLGHFRFLYLRLNEFLCIFNHHVSSKKGGSYQECEAPQGPLAAIGT